MMNEIEEIIDGAIHDCLADWKSDYKLEEDLPALSEIITEEVLKVLKIFNYTISRVEETAE